MVGFVLVVEGGPAAMDAMVNGGRGGNGGYVASGVLQRTVTERTCPMCPYCGDAMILLTLSDHLGVGRMMLSKGRWFVAPGEVSADVD